MDIEKRKSEWSDFYDDIIYDPKSKKNEEDSALLATNDLIKLGLPQLFIEKVNQLILATKHVFIPDDLDSQLLVDIDLSILGKNSKSLINMKKESVRNIIW